MMREQFREQRLHFDEVTAELHKKFADELSDFKRMFKEDLGAVRLAVAECQQKTSNATDRIADMSNRMAQLEH